MVMISNHIVVSETFHSRSLNVKNQLGGLSFFEGDNFVFQSSVKQYLWSSDYQYSNCANILHNSDRVTNPSNAIDGNLNSYATISSYGGLFAGIGSYSGFLEVDFSSTVLENQVVLVKIETSGDLLDYLVGGSLGNSLASILGSVLFGDHFFNIQLVDSAGNPVITGSSSDNFASTNEVMSVVVDSEGSFFVRIIAPSNFKRIRIEDHTSSLLLGQSNSISLAGVCLEESDSICGPQVKYTNFDGDGLNLSLLGISETPLQQLHFAIDNDDSSFSQISTGVLSLGGSIQQIFYLDTILEERYEFHLNLRKTDDLLNLDLLQSIRVRTYLNGVESTVLTAADFLDLNVLGLFEDGDEFYKIILPGENPFDKVIIELASFVGVELYNQLQINSAEIYPFSPYGEEYSEDIEICEGEEMTLIPEVLDGQTINWYDALAAEIPIFSGLEFSLSDTLSPGIHTFYAKAQNENDCEESIPYLYTVTVNPIQEIDSIGINFGGASGINSEGLYIYYEDVNPIILSPNIGESGFSGHFIWFMVEDGVDIPLEDGMNYEGIVFTISDSGQLTIEGLPFRDHDNPYTFRIEWIPHEGQGCVAPIERTFDLNSQALILNISLVKFFIDLLPEKKVRILAEILPNDRSISVEFQKSTSDLKFISLGSEIIGPQDKSTKLIHFDETPFLGSNYYRLKIQETDKPNNVEFTDVQLIELEVPEKTMVFPSFFLDSINVILPNRGDSPIHILIYNLNGLIVKELNINGMQDSNLIQVNGLVSLEPGQYLLTLNQADYLETFRIVKK